MIRGRTELRERFCGSAMCYLEPNGIWTQLQGQSSTCNREK
jgi:hypothetical protein